MSKRLLAIIILSLIVMVLAKQYSTNQVAAPAYQNNIQDQGVKAFKINEASKI